MHIIGLLPPLVKERKGRNVRLYEGPKEFEKRSKNSLLFTALSAEKANRGQGTETAACRP